MSDRVNGWMKAWGSVMITVIGIAVQAGIIYVLIPWAKDVNHTLAQHTTQISNVNVWVSSHADLVQREKENLRLAVMAEVTATLKDSMLRVMEQSKQLLNDIKDANSASQAASLRLDFLTKQVSDLGTRLDDIHSEMRGATKNGSPGNRN